MDSVEVSTVVYRSPREIFDFLVDFPRYAGYSRLLDEVDCREDDGVSGTRYDITFSWLGVSHTVRSRVTSLQPPNRIDWQLLGRIDARGTWQIAPEPESAPDLETPASRVRLYVEFDPESVDLSGFDLPSFASLDWIVERTQSRVRAEAKRTVERIVADLEGTNRAVDLDVHTTSDAV